MNEPATLLRGFRKEERNTYKDQVQHIKTCDGVKTIYNLLLNATQIPMYNSAFMKNT